VKVYLAAAWGRREEIAEVAERLKTVGVDITSNWLIEEKGMQTGGKEKFLRSRAYIDLADVDRADALVRFTDEVPESTSSEDLLKLLSGARMVETGYALARGKTVYVVGGKQNVFDRLDCVIHIPDVDALVKKLSMED
jgi:nucleoside 2-deoxyribosyltransferase